MAGVAVAFVATPACADPCESPAGLSYRIEVRDTDGPCTACGDQGVLEVALVIETGCANAITFTTGSTCFADSWDKIDLDSGERATEAFACGDAITDHEVSRNAPLESAQQWGGDDPALPSWGPVIPGPYEIEVGLGGPGCCGHTHPRATAGIVVEER